MDWTQIDNRLNDPAFYAAGDHYAAFRLLRDNDPVHWTVDDVFGMKFWAITRYDDVKAIASDADRFSSRNTARLLPTSKRLTPELRYEQLLTVTFAALDDPLHDLYRRPVNRHFSLPLIKRMIEHIDRHVDDILADVDDDLEVNLVEHVTAQLPLRVMLTFLGIPRADWPEMRRRTNQYFLPRDPRFAGTDDPVQAQTDAVRALDEYSRRILAERRRDPMDDFLSVIAQMRIDGDLLSPYEMSTLVTALIRGGLETTASASAIGMWQFLRNPDQRDLLLANPDLIDSAADEILRIATPVRHVLRMARQAVTVGDKHINPGDPVVCYLVSANRDERVFTEPDRFDITRSPNNYLSFGQGIHMCIGRHLARLEIIRLFPKLLERFRDYELVDPHGQPNWTLDTSMNGLAELPVRRAPAVAASISGPAVTEPWPRRSPRCHPPCRR